jgi:hypothetical protein
LHPDRAEWGSRTKTNIILADLWDQLAQINANLVAIGSRKPAKSPKPYPRPGVKKDNEQHFGAEPLPPKELRAWIEEKRKKHAGNSTSDD